MLELKAGQPQLTAHEVGKGPPHKMGHGFADERVYRPILAHIRQLFDSRSLIAFHESNCIDSTARPFARQKLNNSPRNRLI